MNEIFRLASTFFKTHELTVDLGAGGDLLELNAVQAELNPSIDRAAPPVFPGPERDLPLLPYLENSAGGAFSNLLAVESLDLIERENVLSALLGFARILKPGGRALLSWSEVKLASGPLILMLESVGFQILLSRPASSEISGWDESLLVAEKSDSGKSRGLERIQSMLTPDKKPATLKLALIRALVVLSRTESKAVKWQKDKVLVPLWSIARQWFIDFWSLLSEENTLPPNTVPFRTLYKQLAKQFPGARLSEILTIMDDEPALLLPALTQLGDTIRQGPVQFSALRTSPLFAYETALRSSLPEQQLGWIAVPQAVWLDLSRLNQWVEESLILRWARLIQELNPQGQGLGHYLTLLLRADNQAQATLEVRNILRESGGLRCVWTDKQLPADFSVDAVIPHSLWGACDLWNLLPCDSSVEQKKRGQLPELALIRKRGEAIVFYWEHYRKFAPARFTSQLRRAFGVSEQAGWEKFAISGLIETVQRLSAANR